MDGLLHTYCRPVVVGHAHFIQSVVKEQPGEQDMAYFYQRIDGYHSSGKSSVEIRTIHDVKEAQFASSRVIECLVPFEVTDTTLMLGIVRTSTALHTATQ